MWWYEYHFVFYSFLKVWLVIICYGLDWCLYVYFSICICKVFNLTIFIFYIGEKFSFCVFWALVIYRVGVLSGCKICPIYGYFSVSYLIDADNDIFSFWCESICDWCKFCTLKLLKCNWRMGFCAKLGSFSLICSNDYK